MNIKYRADVLINRKASSNAVDLFAYIPLSKLSVRRFFISGRVNGANVQLLQEIFEHFNG